MERKKTSKPAAEITDTGINSEILARINAKIAQAHEDNQKALFYQKKRKTGGTSSSHYSIISFCSG